MVLKIISGGQTGADRGGLEAGRALQLEIGGYCPKGRRAEDGKVPAIYPLEETASSSYPDRTAMNVIRSDGTLVFTRGAAERGSLLTIDLARQHAKPFLHLDLDGWTTASAVVAVQTFLESHSIQILNVAGNRESVAPGIGAEVKGILMYALRREVPCRVTSLR